MKIVQKYRVISVIFFCLVILFSWQWAQILEQPVVTQLGPPTTATGNEPIQPIPLQVEFDPEKAALGKTLFHDRRLSQNNSIACASCHDLSKGGTDRRVHSIGINGREGFVNALTILNSSFHFKQFWDGRAQSMEAQIDGPIHNFHEMGSNWPQIIGKLQQSTEYENAFRKLYLEGITEHNIKDALVTFERSLYTPNSRFVRFLRGDTNILTSEEKEGYRRFKDYGCVSCHQGILLGGNMYQKFGVFGDYFRDRGNVTHADLGRFNVTQKEEDRYVFKVPSLRNIVLTAPYFHDGSAETLNEAVKVMVKYQLGRNTISEKSCTIEDNLIQGIENV
jgi:cytochrome c peroxidase